MRVLVCGGRTYGDWETVRRELDHLHLSTLWEGPITCVIHGGARGADSLAHRWAKERSIPIERYPADWSRGLRGGPERNARMLREGRPDLVVAFPGNKGTADMVGRARAAGLQVIEVQRYPRPMTCTHCGLEITGTADGPLHPKCAAKLRAKLAGDTQPIEPPAEPEPGEPN